MGVPAHFYNIYPQTASLMHISAPLGPLNGMFSPRIFGLVFSFCWCMHFLINCAGTPHVLLSWCMQFLINCVGTPISLFAVMYTFLMNCVGTPHVFGLKLPQLAVTYRYCPKMASIGCFFIVFVLNWPIMIYTLNYLSWLEFIVVVLMS